MKTNWVAFKTQRLAELSEHELRAMVHRKESTSEPDQSQIVLDLFKRRPLLKLDRLNSNKNKKTAD